MWCCVVLCGAEGRGSTQRGAWLPVLHASVRVVELVGPDALTCLLVASLDQREHQTEPRTPVLSPSKSPFASVTFDPFSLPGRTRIRTS